MSHYAPLARGFVWFFTSHHKYAEQQMTKYNQKQFHKTMNIPMLIRLSPQ